MTKENLPRIGSDAEFWMKNGRAVRGVFSHLTPDETAIVVMSMAGVFEAVIQVDQIEGYSHCVAEKEMNQTP